MATTIALIVVSAYAAVLTFLKAVAPKTATTKDDKVLEYMEKAEPVVELIADAVKKDAPAAPAAPAADASAAK